MEEKENDLYVPNNCSPLDYIIEGFTNREIAYIAAVGVIALIVAIYMYAKLNMVFQAVFVVVLSVAFAIMFFRRDGYSENCVDKIRIIISYNRSQKGYEYEYKNIYELEEEDGEK